MSTLSINNSTFSGNNSGGGGSGGGIFNELMTSTLSVVNSTFSGNSSLDGGGIFIFGGTVSVSNSTFSGNSAHNGLGGGGIFIYVGSTASVSNSTFSDNSTNIGGGGINNWGTLNLSNSTFSGNSAHRGGGIDNQGTLTASNSTFSGNSAGGIYSSNNGTLNLSNTILANSPSGDDCVNDGGMVNASGVNLVETGNCVSPGPNVLTADPKLGPLKNNGGPTKTMALLAGSPALDAADNALCAADPVNNLDQRGAPRPYGSSCDIGAFEYGAIAADLAGATAAIPTLSEWALLLLSGLLGLVTALTLRRSPH